VIDAVEAHPTKAASTTSAVRAAQAIVRGYASTAGFAREQVSKAA
jgi:hypothetical protein